ncbi:hypothetical protein T439DRAFT_327969 [Meredithblackwellia eburnea MCA 4105]
MPFTGIVYTGIVLYKRFNAESLPIQIQEEDEQETLATTPTTSHGEPNPHSPPVLIEPQSPTLSIPNSPSPSEYNNHRQRSRIRTVSSSSIRSFGSTSSSVRKSFHPHGGGKAAPPTLSMSATSPGSNALEDFFASPTTTKEQHSPVTALHSPSPAVAVPVTSTSLSSPSTVAAAFPFPSSPSIASSSTSTLPPSSGSTHSISASESSPAVPSRTAPTATTNPTPAPLPTTTSTPPASLAKKRSFSLFGKKKHQQQEPTVSVTDRLKRSLSTKAL